MQVSPLSRNSWLEQAAALSPEPRPHHDRRMDQTEITHQFQVRNPTGRRVCEAVCCSCSFAVVHAAFLPCSPPNLTPCSAPNHSANSINSII